MIEGYQFGKIKIDGKEYTSDVIVDMEKVNEWWRKEGHEVCLEDIEKVFMENPEVLVFGTGSSGLMQVLPKTEEYLVSKGIQVIIKPTAQAIEEYNRLEQEGKKVVGLFHLTC